MANLEIQLTTHRKELEYLENSYWPDVLKTMSEREKEQLFKTLKKDFEVDELPLKKTAKRL